MSLLQALRSQCGRYVSGSMAVVFALLLAVELSAMGVIYSTYRSRALFAELEKMRDNAADMQITWSQLLLEQSTLASFSRVVVVAKTQLSMTVPDPGSIVILQQP